MMLQLPDRVHASDDVSVFDRTTGLIPNPAVPGEFSIDLDAAWSSLMGMHGGYLAAVAIAAASKLAGDRPIRTVTTSFLRPALAKPATVSVDVVRAGRSITNLSVNVTQADKVVLISQVIAAEATESTAWDTAAKLDLVPFE